MIINVNLKILEEVIQNQRLMSYVKDKLEDLNFSGLNEDQITKIEYANSIYVRQKQFFENLENKINPEEQFKDLEKISNPDTPIIERIFQCKTWELSKHLVVPGDGKKCVIALHGIHSLLTKEKIDILEALKNNGYGGSILIFEGVGLGPLEKCLIREKKLGAIIHNTGFNHESTLHEILDHSFVSQEERAYCFSIPHNNKGEHGSEYQICSKDFMGKVTNFL